MNKINTEKPKKVINELIKENSFFPNHPTYSLLIYQEILFLKEESPNEIKKLLFQNNWKKSWVNGIYDYHHYHSNTHEVLVMIQGKASVQIGGPNRQVYEVEKGDVIILPAGVSHKKIEASPDFKCIGAYPFDIDYDMGYGKRDEYLLAKENIKQVGLPKADPIFGENGLLFDYWK